MPNTNQTPRHGIRQNPYNGLKYPNAGKPANRDSETQQPKNLWSDLHSFTEYLEITAEPDGTPRLGHVKHSYSTCTATNGMLVPLSTGFSYDQPSILSYLDSCPTCIERHHQALQAEIDNCYHSSYSVKNGRKICGTCEADVTYYPYLDLYDL